MEETIFGSTEEKEGSKLQTDFHGTARRGAREHIFSLERISQRGLMVVMTP